MACRGQSDVDSSSRRQDESVDDEHSPRGSEPVTRSLATAENEHPTFLEAGSETIFAVLTTPATDPLGIGVILLPGGGVPLTTGRNRMSVRICRDVASMG